MAVFTYVYILLLRLPLEPPRGIGAVALLLNLPDESQVFALGFREIGAGLLGGPAFCGKERLQISIGHPIRSIKGIAMGVIDFVAPVEQLFV